MLKKLNFQKKLFIILSAILTVFAVLIMIFQFEREKDFRKRQLENTLDNICELTHKYIERNALSETANYRLLDSLRPIIPGPDTRITLISSEGHVLYDSEVSDFKNMENHLYRPEVLGSVAEDFGANIRESATTGNSYYYYVKHHSAYYIRAAALYNIEMRDFLQAEKFFILFLAFIFPLIWASLYFITRKLTETITKLKDFAIRLSTGKKITEPISFPNNELGAISNQLVAIFNALNKAKEEISVEKSKLYSHLHALNEGIAFFSPSREKILTNNHFIHFLNLISGKSSISAEKIFETEEMKPVLRFIDKQINSVDAIDVNELPQTEISLYKNDKYFNVQCIIFQDKSFEIVITDTTKLEKRRLIKQQMTSNIAHELKTPVATVMGYLETLQHNTLTQEKQEYFIKKAHSQIKRLSNLIEDISMLNRIDEAKEHFSFDKLSINDIVIEVNESLKLKLEENNTTVNILFKDQIIVNGNQSLLFSVFYNLFDNVIKYGGGNNEININSYLADEDYYYFSFSNTGNDIDKKHLSRIFERFYRIDTGRSRKTGGTGLGLAIVKNALQFHGGEISARNYKSGGIEFLFTLAK